MKFEVPGVALHSDVRISLRFQSQQRQKHT